MKLNTEEHIVILDFTLNLNFKYDLDLYYLTCKRSGKRAKEIEQGRIRINVR